jgi:hypothetical protein
MVEMAELQARLGVKVELVGLLEMLVQHPEQV